MEQRIGRTATATADTRVGGKLTDGRCTCGNAAERQDAMKTQNQKHYATYTPTAEDLKIIREPATPETDAEAQVRLKALNRLYARLLKAETDTTLVRNAAAKIRRERVTGEQGYTRTVRTSEVSPKALLKAKALRVYEAAPVIKDRTIRPSVNAIIASLK